MKAKTKVGKGLLTLNDFDVSDGVMLINFRDKYTYLGFKQYKNKLIIDTTEGIVEIVFTSVVPVLVFDNYNKDQLTLKS